VLANVVLMAVGNSKVAPSFIFQKHSETGTSSPDVAIDMQYWPASCRAHEKPL
jgi:hypothetical protein